MDVFPRSYPLNPAGHCFFNKYSQLPSRASISQAAANALLLDVCVGSKDLQEPTPYNQWDSPPFKTIMSANRAEIAVRINRAATELNMETVRSSPCLFVTFSLENIIALVMAKSCVGGSPDHHLHPELYSAQFSFLQPALFSHLAFSTPPLFVWLIVFAF